MLFDPDVRAVVRLLGDLSGGEEALSITKRALLGQLCELIEGDRWRWALERRAEARAAGELIDFMEGGRDSGLGAAGDLDSRGGREVNAGRSRLRDDNRALSLGTGTPVATATTERGQSPGVRRLPSEGETTLTVRQISGDLVSSICLLRCAGRAPFSAKEIKMAQIVLSEIPWLHEAHPQSVEALPAGKGPGKAAGKTQVKSLAPRQRAVLVHWVDGLSSRAIAEKLRISPYTVQDYIKGIYKHYRVNGRAELLKQMTLGWEHRIS